MPPGVRDEPGLGPSLLSRSAFFRYLPDDARAEIGARMRRVDVPAGSAIVHEGEPAHSYFLIAAGDLEVWTGRGSAVPEAKYGGTLVVPWRAAAPSETLVGTLGPADGFGELALLLGRPRGATVLAVSDAVLYRLDADVFLGAIERHRGLAMGLEEEMLLRAIATSLGKSSPFGDLPAGALRWLATRVETKTYVAGEVIVRQGDVGDALYVIRSGSVEVIRTKPDGTRRRADVMSAGDAFGEQSLLTGEPRSATVRARDPVDALRIGREDLRDVVRDYADRERYFVDLVFRRQHPRRIARWSLQPRGDRSFVLADDARHRYVLISEEVALLWELMDGTRNVRDLTVAYAERFGAFAVQAVIDAMLQLHTAGFVVIQRIAAPADRPGPIASAVAGVRRLLTSSVSIPDADPAVTTLHRWLRPLLTWPAQVAFVAVAAVGALLFARELVSGDVGSVHAGVATATLFAGLLAHAVVHEAAHAVVCKHFGRSVHRAGIGWSLFVPAAFVDTSDAWMAPPRARMAIALAGPYANFVLSGALMVAAQLTGAGDAALLQVATTGYIVGVVNLNPLVEFDGYFALMDLLDIPNLRARALAFIGGLRRRDREVLPVRTARIFAGYGALSLAYTIFIVYTVITGYERYVAPLVAGVLPSAAASTLGWALAAVIAYLVLRQAWSALRARRPT